MKIMCDTNVIIDVLLEREPFVENSCSVLSLCERHKIDGFVPASSLTFILAVQLSQAAEVHSLYPVQ